MNTTYDAVVIGAGIAGLIAARAVSKAQKRVLLLEAASRVGGRIWTVPGIMGALPSELGAEFVHGKPESTLRLAREAGVELIPLAERHVVKEGAAFHRLPDPWQALSAAVEHVQPQDEDTDARTFLELNAIEGTNRERIRQLVEGFEAAPLSEIGIQSLVVAAHAHAEDDAQFRVRGGYGTLVDFCLEQLLQARVEVRLHSRVSWVKWQMHGPVELGVADSQREIRARTCIVTVPLPTLQNGESLRFEPTVRAWSDPLTKLGMGHAARVMLQFRRDFAEHAAPRNAFVHHPSALFESFWAVQNDSFVQWTAWAGGPKAAELARESSEQRKRLAVASLGGLLGVPESTLSASLICPIQHHDFSNDEHIRGAYGFSRPGGSSSAEALSAPVGSALFLAGEATSPEDPGTVAGAIESGERAARQALSALGS
ncbi:MAG TPA: NAD(P)/FAD-dependent oxidoreductase [Polyangiaceae bacterium]|nr:NAD(P)/FAD-dependent oxidoreductase [Polyangiaceae bacterium]